MEPPLPHFPFTPHFLQSGHSFTTPPNCSPWCQPNGHSLVLISTAHLHFSKCSFPPASVAFPTACYFNSLVTLLFPCPSRVLSINSFHSKHPLWASSLICTVLITTYVFISSTPLLPIHIPLLSPKLYIQNTPDIHQGVYKHLTLPSSQTEQKLTLSFLTKFILIPEFPSLINDTTNYPQLQVKTFRDFLDSCFSHHIPSIQFITKSHQFYCLNVSQIH